MISYHPYRLLSLSSILLPFFCLWLIGIFFEIHQYIEVSTKGKEKEKDKNGSDQIRSYHNETRQIHRLTIQIPDASWITISNHDCRNVTNLIFLSCLIVNYLICLYLFLLYYLQKCSELYAIQLEGGSAVALGLSDEGSIVTHSLGHRYACQ